MSNNTSDRPMTPVTEQSEPQLLSCGDIRERHCLLKQELGRRVEGISLRKSANKFVREAASLNAGGAAHFGAAGVLNPNPDSRAAAHRLQDADSSSRKMLRLTFSSADPPELCSTAGS